MAHQDVNAAKPEFGADLQPGREAQLLRCRSTTHNDCGRMSGELLEALTRIPGTTVMIIGNAGCTEKLPTLSQLGINKLWFMGALPSNLDIATSNYG